jgi:hypothetical protein
MVPGRWLAAAIALSALLLVPAQASAIKYAPINRDGPKLTVSKADLRGSVECTAGVRDASRQPVLLLPATGVDSEHNFSWNYERAFADAGIPFCTSDQAGELGRNMDDIQTRGEYVTYAIRKVHRMAGRKIATLGHSQGGMITRWSLRFWPDTRRLVDDVIGMAGSNHGSESGTGVCSGDDCAAAFHQQGADAKFIAALNSRQETFRRVSYTEIYTNNDTVVVPPESSGVGGPGQITNVAIQEICPSDPEEHLAIGTSDATAHALVVDALEHPGPADPERIDAAVCSEPFMPGIDPSTYAADSGRSAAFLGESIVTYPRVPAEPKLRCYVRLSCKGKRK